MAYINEVQIKASGASTFSPYLIEPTLYAKPTLSGTAYSYSDNSSSIKNFTLVKGVAIQAQFANTNPANATLNINNTGAKPIYYGNNAIVADLLTANRTYTLVYDDANNGRWYLVGDIDTNTNTTYTFAGGTNGFTVTPSGGSAQTVTVTPSITNNITGSGTSGSLVKFNGANSITDGPALDNSTTNKWLNKKGEWSTPTAAEVDAASSGHNHDTNYPLKTSTTISGGKATKLTFTNSFQCTIGANTSNSHARAYYKASGYGISTVRITIFELADNPQVKYYIPDDEESIIFCNTGNNTQTLWIIMDAGNLPTITTDLTIPENPTYLNHHILTEDNYKTYAWARPSSIVTDQVILSSGTNGTTTLRGITNNTSAGALGWVSNNTTASNLQLLTVNTLAYWDGRYRTTNNDSNLEYYKGGKFGTMAKETASDYAKLNSPSLSGTPTAPTAANGTNTTQIATTEFVNNTLSYINSMQFKGTIGTDGTVTALPNTHEAGWTYRVKTADTYPIVDSNGKYCEIGTLIICVNDGTTAAAADWTAVETNEDGSVIGPSSSTNEYIAVFDGTTGRIIKSGGTTIANASVNYATSAGSAATISTTGGSTALFWRGDNSWSDTINGGTLKITNNSNTITIGSTNTKFGHIENSANIPFYFNKQIQANGGFKVYNTTTTLTSTGLNISASTAATSTTVGSIVTAGGIATGQTSWLSGPVHIVGAVGDNKQLIARGLQGCNANGTMGSDANDYSAVYWGLYLNYAGGPVHIGSTSNDTLNAHANNLLKVYYSQDASSTSTGAVVIDGGVGIGKTLYVGKSIYTANIGDTSTGIAAEAAMQIREYNYAGAGSDTWGVAPRLAWNWNGRKTAQIGLASNGYLYEAPNSGTTYYKLVYENGTWGINVSGSANRATYLITSRVAEDCQTTASAFPAKNRSIMKEYTSGANYNLPSNAWYHILSTQGNDTKYGTQLALGMTTAAVYYRKYDNQTWGDWLRLLDSGNTYAADSNGSDISVTWNSSTTIATINGVAVKIKIPKNPNTNTASAVDNILAGSNDGTAITYAPYTSQQSKLSFDTSTTAPSRTDRLNLNGYLYATKLYSDGTEVSVSGHTHSYIPLAGSNAISGDLEFNTTGKGIYLKDSASKVYAGIYDNGTNIWIGATSSTGQHHKGNVYISAGHNGTSGNKSIYISIPANGNATTTHTSYPLVYKGSAGGTDAPIYIDSDGKTCACTTYANASVKSATTATNLVDAGKTDRTLTIRYGGNGASATDWIPMHDSNGNLVPVSSTNLANKVRDKASGSWDINSSSTDKLNITSFDVQTGSSTKSHITLDTLLTWLITTKKYIPSKVWCKRTFQGSWAYSRNDYLQITCEGTQYEIQLAGCLIEWDGYASDNFLTNNDSWYRLRIHNSPANNYTVAEGYTKAPLSAVFEYFYNGSSYAPTWRCLTHALAYVPLTGGTLTGDLELKTTVSGNSPAIIFNRAYSTQTDWKLVVTAGKFSFQSCTDASSWTERASFADNSGNFTTTGTITATGFSGPLTGNVTGDCSGSSGSCIGLSAKATADADGNTISSTYLKLSGGDMTGASGIQFPTASGNNKTGNWISAGGGYSTGSGKSGVKIIVCEQSDAVSGLGQDCDGGPYELSIIAPEKPSDATVAYIRFLKHNVNTATTYTKLGEIDGSGNFSVIGKITNTITTGSALQIGNNSVLAVTENATAASRIVNIKGLLCLNRESNQAFGRISFYKSAYHTWITYMSDVGNGKAPTGGKPGSIGNVTGWALRSLLENNTGQGWMWEAAAEAAASANTVQPTVRMALSSVTGYLRIAPDASTTTCETGGLIIDAAKNASSGNVAIELWRGTKTSWQIANESGTLYIRDNYNSSAATTTYTHTNITIACNTGNTTFAGSVTATGGFSGALSGTADAAETLTPTHVAGFTSDAYGNFKHKRNTTTDYWQLQNSAGTTKFSVYWETGNVTAVGTVTAADFSGPLTGNASSATKVAAKLATTTKTFLLGTSTTITATAANVDLIGDTGVYLTKTAGQLSATSYYINDGTNEKIRLEWNSTDQSLDFIFT